jgi:serine/threonine-protein kinase HipA
LKVVAGTPLEISLNWDEDDIQPVGRLAYRDQIAYLEYDEAFLRSGLDISPVHYKASAGVRQPYDATVFQGLHGVFHDSLPDGWGRLLIDRRAHQLGIEPSTLTPLDRLACVGSTGIGALCYAPSINVWDADDKKLNLDQIASDARLVLEGDVGEVISTLGQAGGSPGGARPKALIGLNDMGQAVHGSNKLPAGFDAYLVKFPGHDDPVDIAAIEMAYAMMAKAAGVVMHETRLLKGCDEQLYFAAKRFDRTGNRRVHIHSASGLLYTDIRIPQLDYKDLLMLTRSVSRDQRECKAMFVLAVFNVLAHNRDDHARQFSYMMSRDGTWKLAPAYDLTWCSGPAGEHSTTVLGYGKDITRAQLLELGKKAELKTQDAKEIIERVEAATGNWQVYAGDYGVSRKSNDMIAKSLAKLRL